MRADFRRVTIKVAAAFLTAACLFALCACNEPPPAAEPAKGLEVSGRITSDGENLSGVSVLSENGEELASTDEYGIFTADCLNYGEKIVFKKEGFSFSPSEHRVTESVYDLNVKASAVLPPDEPDNPDEPEEPDIPDEPETPETVLNAPRDLYLSHFGDSLCISFTADANAEAFVMQFVFDARELAFTVSAEGGTTETDGKTLTVHRTENADGTVAFIAAVNALTEEYGAEFSLTVTAKAADADDAVSSVSAFDIAAAAAVADVTLNGVILKWRSAGENAEEFVYLVNVNGVTLARTEATEFDLSTLSYDIPAGASLSVAALLHGRVAAASSAIIFGGTESP